MNETQTPKTLAALLRPFRVSAVVQATGRSKQAVNNWHLGRALPDVSCLPKLAAFLRIDLGELTQIVAADAQRIERGRSVA